MPNDSEIIDNIANKEYEFGFVTDIEMDIAPAGLNEDTIRYISEKKKEPEWLLEWRLKGYQSFIKQKLPEWQNFVLPTIDFQNILSKIHQYYFISSPFPHSLSPTP